MLHKYFLPIYAHRRFFGFAQTAAIFPEYAGLSFTGQILFPGMAGELSLPRYLRQKDGFPDPDRRSCLTVPVLFRKRAPHPMMIGCLQKRREIGRASCRDRV